ncbi:unnamed protein product [Gadus morhua 'NCC']
MEETGGTGAIGAQLPGGGFDLQKFARQPQTIVRFFSWIFSIVVFGTVTAEGWVNPRDRPEAQCVFNGDGSACRYAVGVGVLAFLGSSGFLLMDVALPAISDARRRRYAVMADLGFSGVWSFLWFVCFCLLASLWGQTSDVRGIPEDAARAAVAFSFFSSATWAILTYFALSRYRHGMHGVGVPTSMEPPAAAPTAYATTPYAPTSYSHSAYHPTTYPGFPSGGGGDPYQQTLFTAGAQPQGGGAYQPPPY